MKYGKLLQLAGKKEKVPSLEPVKWNGVEQGRIDQGLCISCGLQPAGKTSYLCSACEDRQTIEDIEAEISSIRRSLLKNT